MNRTTVPALALVAIAALVAPSGAASKGPAAGKTVHVGVIADVTGAAGVYGTPQKNAYDLANDDIKALHQRVSRQVQARRQCGGTDPGGAQERQVDEAEVKAQRAFDEAQRRHQV